MRRWLNVQKYGSIGQKFEKFELTENMRTSHKEFSKISIAIGPMVRLRRRRIVANLIFELDEKWIVKPDTLIETIFDRNTLNSDDIRDDLYRVIMAPTE